MHGAVEQMRLSAPHHGTDLGESRGRSRDPPPMTATSTEPMHPIMRARGSGPILPQDRRRSAASSLQLQSGSSRSVSGGGVGLGPGTAFRF
jgi:hypothetical protein